MLKPLRRLGLTLALCTITASAFADVAIVVHGGAGTILKKDMTAEKEAQYVAKLKEAITSGHAALKAGKSGEEVVVSTIQTLEASPLFNAGVGAVYTYDEEHELDASIMHGATRKAGAVAGVKTIKSPIAAAQAVMNKSEHVMLSGQGAETFAQEQGLEMVENSYFDTSHRLEALKKAKVRMKAAGKKSGGQKGAEKMGTVGVVVMDSKGNIVAGTSTGGMTAKRYGRIGDSPVIGAGTFADNDSCGVSATGHGEFFIRYNVAADICARVRYHGVSVTRAADTVINDVLKEAGGTGGVIAIDRQGHIAMPFNTAGMYRASIDADGTLNIGIYKDMLETSSVASE
ncbi:isoaspartyl peptidase/L-asparaginase family protein [Salinimonas iocasae]|uniref:Isoaspartyl peptidase n=1 Tax=Salinimonas iocasae TaxID=2572577 RepID=A0A5B7YDX4_9ALTE|nr:isoaspartyl peptidase/L-asparaginase [Salinimonas iocasae]QCZ93791.1 isoaspartyl peptidase/L-asparaginase [Salinimonas iocasae]